MKTLEATYTNITEQELYAIRFFIADMHLAVTGFGEAYSNGKAVMANTELLTVARLTGWNNHRLQCLCEDMKEALDNTKSHKQLVAWTEYYDKELVELLAENMADVSDTQEPEPFEFIDQEVLAAELQAELDYIPSPQEQLVAKLEQLPPYKALDTQVRSHIMPTWHTPEKDSICTPSKLLGLISLATGHVQVTTEDGYYLVHMAIFGGYFTHKINLG